MKQWLGKFVADMLPVMAGILIALLLNDWKEKQDDQEYLDTVFSSIEQEIQADLADVVTVETKQLRLLDTMYFYMDSVNVSIGEVIGRSNGLQLVVNERTSWDALLNNRIELVDYKTVNILSGIDGTNASMDNKIEGLMAFVGNGVRTSVALSREESERRNAAQQAYEMSGVGPEDLDLVELHDCFATAELIHYDNLGLCEPGGAGDFIDSGAPFRDGRTPVNVSGGLISKGHPIGATGVANIYEVVTHLRGEAGDRQVTSAKVGLAHVIGLGSACGVHILEKAA